VGPRFTEPRIVIHVTFQGRPISIPYKVLLLLPRPAGKEDDDAWSDNMMSMGNFAWVKEFDRKTLVDEDGNHWGPLYRPHIAGQTSPLRSDTVSYSFRYGRPPERVRLLVYLPDEKRFFVTNEAPTQSYYSDLTADLSTDGTASLKPSTNNALMLIVGVLRDKWPVFLVAFFLTLAIELPILAICAGRGGRREVVWPLLGWAVLANLLTLQAVWLVTVGCKVAGSPDLWFPVFLCCEVAAACFEGWFYARFVGVRLGQALLWSGIANAASFLVGCGLTGLTV
jgi:hypothetical protein